MEGGLLEKDAKKFIENDGSKRYRISTLPDFVTYDRGNLLKHSEVEGQNLLKDCLKTAAVDEGRNNLRWASLHISPSYRADRDVGLRRYVVLINGKVVEMPYGLLVLFLYLAIFLKQERNLGWVTIDDLEKEGILDSDNITHLHRIVSELKKLIKYYIEDNGKVELIENIKKKSKYRLSTMPSRIKAPHVKWLAATYNKIKIEVLKERQKRKAKAAG